MTENEAYSEYVAARTEAQAVYDALVKSGKTSTISRITNAKYQAAVAKEHAAWVQFLTVHDE